MFLYIKGRIKQINELSIVVESNNIGYEVFVVDNNYEYDNEVTLFIYDYLKEDAYLLVGFNELNELKFFKKLLMVAGIGPKTALSLMNKCNYKELIKLIKTKDKEGLKLIAGVGNKADAIIYTLQNKLNEFDINLFSYKNVYSALKNLGYSSVEIELSLAKIEEGLSDEEALKLALKGINTHA